MQKFYPWHNQCSFRFKTVTSLMQINFSFILINPQLRFSGNLAGKNVAGLIFTQAVTPA